MRSVVAPLPHRMRALWPFSGVEAALYLLKSFFTVSSSLTKINETFMTSSRLVLPCKPANNPNVLDAIDFNGP